MEAQGIQVLWRDTLPDGVYLVAEGPERRLLINKTWWHQASLRHRREVVNRVTNCDEDRTIGFVVTGGGHPTGARRLAWLEETPLAWWLWLLQQEGDG